jgi:hypothetical protein
VAYENSDKTITANNHMHNNVKGMLLQIGVIFVNSISKTHCSKGSFGSLNMELFFAETEKATKIWCGKQWHTR